MKMKFVRSYRNKKGNLVFVYQVIATGEQLAAYKKAQGDNYREDDDKNPLFFSPRYVGESAAVNISANGKAFADTSAFDKADSIAKQYGGNLGQEIAKHAAASLLGSSTPASVGVGSTIDAL